jgi:riboflavin kinase / FMN adenylyltransferase
VSAGDEDGRPRVVATIGVFDGVHRGHRALVETVIRRAAHLGIRSLVVTFDPHPVTVLADPVPPHLLTGRALQLRYLAELGVDLAWMLPFSRRLAAMEPGVFVEGLLLRHAAIAELWVGHDFRFGRGRAGDTSWLRAEGARRGFAVHEFAPVMDGDRPFSSTRIRAALAVGDIEEAVRMLGHTVLVEGRVGRGRGQGARILVPTANLDLPAEQFLPAHGVYAAWAEIPGSLVPAVVNVGVRPTLLADSATVVEAHLLGWDGDLRGARLGLHFGTMLRQERKFNGLNELRVAIEADMAAAGRWLAEHPFRTPATRSRAGTPDPPCEKDDIGGNSC